MLKMKVIAKTTCHTDLGSGAIPTFVAQFRAIDLAEAFPVSIQLPQELLETLSIGDVFELRKVEP